jgi:hypothetical protein
MIKIQLSQMILKIHQCVELSDSFPMMQKLPQTEFVCKIYGWSKFKSTRAKGKKSKGQGDMCHHCKGDMWHHRTIPIGDVVTSHLTCGRQVMWHVQLEK